MWSNWSRAEWEGNNESNEIGREDNDNWAAARGLHVRKELVLNTVHMGAWWILLQQFFEENYNYNQQLLLIIGLSSCNQDLEVYAN